MDIIINTDNHIKGSEDFQEKYKAEIQQQLKRFDEYITRYEVFFKDVSNSHKAIDDKHCTIEARVKGRNPESVTHEADTVAHAFSGAIDKMRGVLDRVVDHHRKSH